MRYNILFLTFFIILIFSSCGCLEEEVGNDPYDEFNFIDISSNLTAPIILGNGSYYENEIVYFNGSFVIFLGSGHQIEYKTSFDLKNWTEPKSLPFDPNRFTAIHWSDILYLYYWTGVGDSNLENDHIWVSFTNDLVNWSEPEIVEVAVGENIVVNNNGKLICAETLFRRGSRITQSENGLDWIPISNISQNVREIYQLSNNQFFIIEGGGEIFSSYDLENWIKVTEIYWGNNIEMIETENGRILIVADVRSYSQPHPFPDVAIYDVTDVSNIISYTLVVDIPYHSDISIIGIDNQMIGICYEKNYQTCLQVIDLENDI